MLGFAGRFVSVVFLLIGMGAFVPVQGGQAGDQGLLAYAHPAGAQSKGKIFKTISEADLPPQARETLRLIANGGPFPYRKDGTTFRNREKRLPSRPLGYYKEYTVKTPGIGTRGARRIIAGAGGEFFYTDDHYRTFRRIRRDR